MPRSSQRYEELTVVNAVNILDDGALQLGDDSDASILYNTIQTADSMFIGVGADSNVLVIAQEADKNFDFAHSAVTHPRVVIHSANQSTSEWVGFTHNSTDAQIITGAGQLVLLPATTVSIGNLGTTSHGLAADDLLVTGELEVDGAIWADSDMTFADNAFLLFGAGQETAIVFDTAHTLDSLTIVPDSTGMVLAIVSSNFQGQDHVLAGRNDPTIMIFSDDDPDVSPNRFLGLSADNSNGIIIVGTGNLNIESSAGQGQSMNISSTTETLTFAANPGDASKVTSGLIPDGAFLIGITTRVITAGTNATSMDIGDGTTVDLYADNAAITDTSTTNNSNATAVWTNPNIGAGEVTITAVGGNAFDLVVAVTAHYLDLTAATIG